MAATEKVLRNGARPPATMAEAEAAFWDEFPEYLTTRLLDDLRATDYNRLDRLGHKYLDYTGGGLYGESQVRAHMDLLVREVLGNPHSGNPTSQAMTRMIDQVRQRVLEFFSASDDEYVVIFTANASGALKLVGESYPFQSGGQYLLTFDNHNSVNGIREFARAKGATVTYAPVLPPDMYIDAGKLTAYLHQIELVENCLFAYPAQSNFSGVQHSLGWIERAHSRGWDVLLDAAAFVPSNRLDLGVIHPDFVSLSFYKVFGYPTGVGCLLARRATLAKLHRPWFAGGTITVASVQGDRFYFQEGAEAFEDGTVNYLSLPAVLIGLDHIARIGVDMIHTRVKCLTGWLLDQLASLQHESGIPLVRVYGPVDTLQRGGTVTFNFYDARGHFIDHRFVEHRANQVNISLRTGCFCNPGGGELALGLSAEELTSCFIHSRNRLSMDEFRRCIDDKSTGAVRVSVGMVTTFKDVFQFIQFARTFLDRTADEI